MKSSSGNHSQKPRKKPAKLRGIDALAMELASIKRGHDPVAADRLIRFFFAELQSGNLFAHGLGQNEKTLLRYIQHAFGRYVDGQPLDTAFGFRLGRGEKDVKLSIDDRNLSIAASVEILVRKDMKDRGISKPRLVMEQCKNGKCRMISTVKMEPIYDEVSKNCEVKSKSIEKIFGDFETATESLPDAHLALLAEHLAKSV